MQHLVWDHSPDTAKFLHQYLSLFNSKSTEDLYLLARNFQEYIGALILSQERMTSIDGSIYFIGEPTNFSLRFIGKAGNRQGFPKYFLESEGIKGENKLIYDIIEVILEKNLKFEIQRGLQVTYDGEVLTYTHLPFIQQNFEKTLLGSFFYLLYLRDLFKNDPNVCVMVSDLKPLFTQTRKLEMALSLHENEFHLQFPKYRDVYQTLLGLYTKYSTPIFRFYLLNTVLEKTGPYLVITPDRFTVSQAFEKLFERCQQSNARYTVAQMVILIGPGKGHANILIFDKNSRILERFEPNGNVEDSSLEEISKLLDEELEKLANKTSYKYLPPSEYCPNAGIQSTEHYFQEQGFCASWSLLYVEERLKSKVSREYFAQNLLQDLVLSNPSLKGRTIEQTFKNLEVWIKNRIEEIFSGMDNYFKELSQELGVNVLYQDRSIILK